ncbi:cytochrome P450 [Trametes polyzona]|nr:cytochrome P450 [Trametes polyzona]
MATTAPDIVLISGAAALLYVGWRLYRFWSFVYRTPLRNLPGPPVSSWIYGNQPDIERVDDTLQPDLWFARYGKNFVDRDFFMRPRVWTLDPRAIQHVLTHADDFPKPPEANVLLRMLLGRGILTAYGDEHKFQRRILNPAFGPAQIRNLTSIFVDKSVELRNIWQDMAKRGSAKIDVAQYLSRMTLDVIGLAGFGYHFNALNAEGSSNELSNAFRQIFTTAPSFSSVGPLLRAMFPIFRVFSNRRVQTVNNSAQVFQSVGARLVAERKAAILHAASEKNLQGIERKDLQGRDLLTLLMKANMAKDIPEELRLSDADVINQIPTFLLAGHETTSSSSNWALYLLSRYPAVQKKLREELLSLDTESPTMDELLSLPYLDGVVRETLRLHSAVGMLIRVATKDAVLPLSEPFTDRYGKTQHEIRIAKGNEVVIPILALHRSKAIWGEDALEFRPERWHEPSDAVAAIPGVWGHLLTFIGGPRACIGYRFSLVELKAILFVLLRALEFELAVPAEDVIAKTGTANRPSLKSEPEKGAQMPLIVKPYKNA